MSTRRWILAGVAVSAVACSGAPEPGPRPPSGPRAASRSERETPTPPASATSPRPEITTSKAPPSPATWVALHEDPEEPCERAERWRDRAKELRARGWTRRAKRLLDRAQQSCSSLDVAKLQAEITGALTGNVGQATLETKMRAAQKAGDDARLRRLSAQWFTAAIKAAPSPSVLFRPSGRVIGFDDTWVVVASERWAAHHQRHSTLTLLHAKTGTPAYQIDAGDYVRAVDHHADQLLTLSNDALSTWSLGTGKRIQSFSWTREDYDWAGFAAGGKSVIAVGEKAFRGVIRRFTSATGASTGALDLPDLRGSQIGARPLDDQHILAFTDGQGLVVNVATLSVARRLNFAKNPKKPKHVASIAVADDGRIAIATEDGRVSVWTKRGRSLITRFETGRRPGRISFAEDVEKLYLLVDGDRELLTYDIKRGIAEFSRPIAGKVAVWGERLLGGRIPTLMSIERKLLWPRGSYPESFGTVQLSAGLAVTHEDRRKRDTKISLHAWYRHQHRALSLTGYFDDRAAISPSGRRVAIFPKGAEGTILDVLTGQRRDLPRPAGFTSVDTIRFQADNRLHVLDDAPVTTKTTTPSLNGWLPGEVKDPGYRRIGTRLELSSQGEVAIVREGKLELATGPVLVEQGASGVLFSGDGERVFTCVGRRLLAFDAAGPDRGSELSDRDVDCQTRHWASNHVGSVLAWTADRKLHILREGAPVVTHPFARGGYPNQLAVSDRLVAAQLDETVVFIDHGGTELARMTLRPDPLVEATDGSLWYPDEPSWEERAVCLVGHRAVPFSWCEDGLLDDTLVERLLVR